MSELARRGLELVRIKLWPYVFFPALFTALPVLFSDRLGWDDVPHLLRDNLIVAICVGPPAHVAFVMLYDWIGGLTPVRQLLAGATIVVVAVLVGTEMALVLLSPLQVTAHHGMSFERQNIWTLALVAVGFVAGVMVTFERYRDRIRAVELRELRTQRDALAVQIEALHARLQPHFLFNCLNTVASLIEDDPRRAETAVERLSDLLRHTLAASRLRFVPLREELAAIEGFLELETLRYDERLRSRVHIDAGLGNIPIPPLILQPLVENAVRHGVADRREGGRVEVRVTRRGDRLILEVEDDGPGPAASRYAGSGTALRDLGDRLRLVYADAAVLTYGQSPLGGFHVHVSLPIREERSACGS